jgi:hypothetical protein
LTALAALLISLLVFAAHFPLILRSYEAPVPAYSGSSFGIFFFINPSDECCTAINFAEAGYSDGDFTYASGNYTAYVSSLSAGCPPACATFVNWTSTGGVVVLNPFSPSTNITVRSAGNLTLNVDYCCSAEPPFKITFLKNPANACCTYLTFKNHSYDNGQSANNTYGYYSAFAVQLAIVCPPNCDFFYKWSSSGGVEVLNPNETNTRVFVAGSGSLIMNLIYSPLSSVTPILAVFSTLSVSAVVIVLKRRKSTFVKL